MPHDKGTRLNSLEGKLAESLLNVLCGDPMVAIDAVAWEKCSPCLSFQSRVK